MDMCEKTAIVTGASGGIGCAISKKLSSQGYYIVINFVGPADDAVKLKADIEAAGGEADLYEADVTSTEEVKALVDFAKAKNGRIDVLVNNAGITRDKLLMQMKDNDIDDVLSINLKSAFLCSRAVTRTMLKQRSGRIINTSSIVGIAGEAGQTNYSASKAGLIGFTKSLAKELASRNITVNAVAPGYIQTNMTKVLPEEVKNNIISSIPLGRPGLPEDVANAVGFLASDDASYITGQVINVSGGLLI
ncbi:MAG: 3-oxoacyl-[Christensenellaceae bacterium]|nr:3-oxoacyl-[acyl-carrier-protein] reductase [Christensenellaceae bacterium]